MVPGGREDSVNMRTRRYIVGGRGWQGLQRKKNFKGSEEPHYIMIDRNIADVVRILQDYHIQRLSPLAHTLPHTLRFLQMQKKRLRHSKPTRRSKFN